MINVLLIVSEYYCSVLNTTVICQYKKRYLPGWFVTKYNYTNNMYCKNIHNIQGSNIHNIKLVLGTNKDYLYNLYFMDSLCYNVCCRSLLKN